MKPLLFFLVVLQLTRIRGQTDGLTGTDEDDIDYKKEYEEVDKLFKDEREKLNIADQRLLEATKKITALETELKQQNDSCALKAQTDDQEQLQEAYEEARKKNDELTQSLNLAEVKVLVLNKLLEANKQKSSIVKNDLTAAELKNAQLTRQLAEANKRPQCNQNETNQLKDVFVQKLALLDEMRTKYSDLQNCPINIGSDSTCKKIRGMGCYCIVEVQKTFDEAAEYCQQNNMKLVGIETREEQELLRGFLTDNLGSREKYGDAFWTSGVDENSDGRWQWTSSKLPLFLHNWRWYRHDEERKPLLVDRKKPFDWFTGRIPSNENFICESSAPEQEIKHLTAYVNAKNCPLSIGIDSTCVYLDPLGCYCLVLKQSNWIEGSRHCKSQGMELVSIESEAENSQIAAFLKEHQSSYTSAFWTSALFNEEKSQWVWTATGQSMNYTNWRDDQPKFDEGEGHTIMLSQTRKMYITRTRSNDQVFSAHYICEKSTDSSVSGPRNNQTEKKSCSAGSDWTCHNEVTGCYCHQTIERNWADASALCESIGMNLVSIETAQEQLLVASGLPEIADATRWWTSGSEAKGGRWTWMATGRDLSYTDWADGKPTRIDNSKHGVIVNGYSNQTTWSNLAVYPVTNNYYPICEKQQGSPVCPSNIGRGTQCFGNETFGCYCLVELRELLNVNDAARFCQSHAMRLLSIESSAEEEHLIQIIKASKFGPRTYWWTSGSDVEVENNWMWTATGQPVLYTNWAPGEPSSVGGVEHFIGIRVSVRGIEWFDFPAKSWDNDNFIKTICEY